MSSTPSPILRKGKQVVSPLRSRYIMAGSYVSFLDVTPRHYGAKTARHNFKTFPPAHLLHTSSPQPQSTLTINEISNELINEITNDKKNTVNITCTCQKWNHDVKNETTMSKLCQTCQKSSTNPQRVNFHFVKIHACINEKWSVRFGPLMTSMKTDFVTKNFDTKILTLWPTLSSRTKITLIYF